MDSLRQSRINLTCLEFIHQTLNGGELSKWAAFRNHFTKLGIEQVLQLSKTVNSSTDTNYLPSDLILMGFGCESITVVELDELMKQENTGCMLQKVATAS